MQPPTFWSLQLIWYNPQEKKPVLKEWRLEKPTPYPIPDQIDQEIEAMMKLNPGYVLGITKVRTQAPKQVAEETKLKRKKTLLINQFKKRYPLLATQLLEEEFRKRGWKITEQDRERIGA